MLIHVISQLDRLVGLAMLIVATAVFTYYTVWTLLMVNPTTSRHNPPSGATNSPPFQTP